MTAVVRPKIFSHRDLEVWQRSMDLSDCLYDVAALLPKTELYSLGAQLRRAAVSVPANIAEGHGRQHLGDYLRHLSYAMGSVMEIDTLLMIAYRRGFISQAILDHALGLVERVGRMLRRLAQALSRRMP